MEYKRSIGLSRRDGLPSICWNVVYGRPSKQLSCTSSNPFRRSAKRTDGSRNKTKFRINRSVSKRFCTSFAHSVAFGMRKVAVACGANGWLPFEAARSLRGVLVIDTGIIWANVLLGLLPTMGWFGLILATLSPNHAPPQWHNGFCLPAKL